MATSLVRRGAPWTVGVCSGRGRRGGRATGRRHVVPQGEAAVAPSEHAQERPPTVPTVTARFCQARAVQVGPGVTCFFFFSGQGSCPGPQGGTVYSDTVLVPSSRTCTEWELTVGTHAASRRWDRQGDRLSPGASSLVAWHLVHGECFVSYALSAESLPSDRGRHFTKKQTPSCVWA